MNCTISEKVNRIYIICLILVLTATACTPNVERLMEKGDVEELIAALSYERNPEVRAEAALALGELGEADAMHPLLALLSDDEDETVRSAAAEALGQICGADAVQPLMNALEDESEDVQEASISALVMCADVAVNSLFEALESEDDDLRHSVVKVLSRMGSSVSSDLAKLLINSDDNVSSGAYDALVMIGSPAIPYIMEMVLESNKVVYDGETILAGEVQYSPYGTAEGLLADGGTCTTPGNWEDKIVLCELGDNSFYEKVQIVQVSGGVGVIHFNGYEGNIYPSLSNESNDVSIVSIAISQEVSQALLADAVGEHIQIFSGDASGAIDVLVAFGESAVPDLINAVKDPTIDNMSTSYFFQDILVSMGSSAVPSIIEMLDDSEASIRYDAVNMLGQIDDERVVEPLIESLKDSDPWVRRKAVKALGDLQVMEAVEPLVNCLADEDVYVYEAAMDALTSFGMPAVDLLMDIYHGETTTEKSLLASALKGIFRENAGAIADVAVSVCSGEAQPDTAEYNRNEGDFHPTIIIDEDGDVHSWTYQLPVDWLPFTPDMLQLVVCLGEEEKQVVEVCQYIYDGTSASAPSITRYRYERDAALYEAFTGDYLDSTVLSGALPDACPQSTSSSTTAITGDNVGVSALAAWLQMYDIPLAD